MESINLQTENINRLRSPSLQSVFKFALPIIITIASLRGGIIGCITEDDDTYDTHSETDSPSPTASPTSNPTEVNECIESTDNNVSFLDSDSIYITDSEEPDYYIVGEVIEEDANRSFGPILEYGHFANYCEPVIAVGSPAYSDEDYDSYFGRINILAANISNSIKDPNQSAIKTVIGTEEHSNIAYEPLFGDFMCSGTDQIVSVTSPESSELLLISQDSVIYKYLNDPYFELKKVNMNNDACDDMAAETLNMDGFWAININLGNELFTKNISDPNYAMAFNGEGILMSYSFADIDSDNNTDAIFSVMDYNWETNGELIILYGPFDFGHNYSVSEHKGRKTILSDPDFAFNQIITGNFDNDSDKEIVIQSATLNEDPFYTPLAIFDRLDGLKPLNLNTDTFLPYYNMQVIDIDSDARDEFLIIGSLKVNFSTELGVAIYKDLFEENVDPMILGASFHGFSDYSVWQDNDNIVLAASIPYGYYDSLNRPHDIVAFWAN